MLAWRVGMEETKMGNARVEELHDLALSMFAANIAVLLSMLRLGLVDRGKLITELRGVIAQLETDERQDLYRHCLRQIVQAIELDDPTKASSAIMQ
jgi:hypothetical protein